MKSCKVFRNITGCSFFSPQQVSVPVWQTGAESKFPGLSYIIFPGNVGEADTLCQLVKGLL